MPSRTFLIAAGIVALALPVVAQADWMSSSAPTAPQRAELYSIHQIESTWHRATTKKNLDLMMTLWAPKATMILGPTTVKGKPAIRAVLSKAQPFQRSNHWISETPAYKIRATVSGTRGTLYFECHYVDVDTGAVKLVAGVSADVQRVKGKWLITKMIASSPTLEP